ncbi:MAG: hexosyltransferase [Acidobacteria bacterium]|nr:MAG: hexosyltransferase [Acidobacteriota bacterium]PYR19992.1 MAG: hexosyltransferase [Acidobacteriota bacterium]PYR53561.1 MAG: hexosyltransferase [Acidobacteriota bacterium]
MKVAVVVQRYGQAINGGAELHARYIAEHLARHGEVEVLTTCAADYVTWRNELEPGVGQVNGVPVRRFRVKHERDPRLFAERSDRVFEQPHSLGDELDWLDAEGPTSPALVDYVAKHAAEYEYCLFFSYRYYHAYYGTRAAGGRAILVPTAERDLTVGLSIFQPLFRRVRAVMYNSPEERAMIHAVSGNQNVPGVVVGIGSDVPNSPQAGRFRQKYHIRGPFAVYVGRIDQNKGCNELFEFFQGYLNDPAGKLSLVLIGHSLLPIPEHPRIRHLGFLDDTDKFDAMAAADLLIMPSYYESLSMVTLETWALGRPVLANGKCDVLKGQCIRSNAGLYYETYGEFVGALEAIEQNRWLAGTLGRSGRQFFRDHYDWPVIERKYLEMFERLKTGAAATVHPLPGWFERRRRDLPAAREVLTRLPKGPAGIRS